MKRIIFIVTALLVLSGLLVFRYTSSNRSPSAIKSTMVEQPEQTKRASQQPIKDATTPIVDFAETATVVEGVEGSESAKTAEAYPQMILDQILQSNNVVRDAVYGVSFTYPKDWSVKQALRWGANKNTIFFNPPEGSKAVPSMYYQKFTESPPDSAYTEAVMREQARLKEASRLQDGNEDYTNDPDSFEYQEIDGNPSLSYFATYTQGDDVEAEYFTRIIGEEGYVMFFVRGPVDDVSELIAPVRQMSETVTPP